MTKLSVLLLLTTFLSCNHKRFNPLAIKLNDSAVKITMNSLDNDTVKRNKAISLLDKATIIDSNYFIAYWNKLSFQMGLKQYDKSLITAKRLISLKPNDAFIQALAGNLSEFKGDSIEAKRYFRTSLSIYNRVLDILNVKDRRYKDIKMAKAVDLIMLHNRNEGCKLLNELYNSTSDTLYKQIYNIFN